MHYSVKPVSQGVRVLFYYKTVMGWKQYFTLGYINSKYVQITTMNINVFYSDLNIWIFAILIPSGWRIHSGGNIYIHYDAIR